MSDAGEEGHTLGYEARRRGIDGRRVDWVTISASAPATLWTVGLFWWAMEQPYRGGADWAGPTERRLLAFAVFVSLPAWALVLACRVIVKNRGR